MRTWLLLALALGSVAWSAPAAAGSDWKAIIARDRVRVADGKLQIEEYQLCKIKVPNAQKSSLQIKTHAETPADGKVSRDFLVSFESTMQTTMALLFSAAAAEGSNVNLLKAMDCNPIAAPIGKVDLELNLYLTGEGFQMEFLTEGKSGRESKRWEDMDED